MTQEELTQIAVLKAKAEKKIQDERKRRIAETPNELEKISESETQEKSDSELDILEPKTQPYQNEDYPYEIVLGENKSFRFNVWTGLTKKKLKKITNDIKEDEYQTLENFNKVLDVIIYDHIDNPDLYMSEVEQQYVALKIRSVSIDDKILFHGICPACKELNEVQTNISSNLWYEEIKYPKTNEQLEIEYVDIESKSDFENKVSEYIDDIDYDDLTTESDIEMAMHIKKLYPDGAVMSYNEILDWMDTLDLKNLKIVLSDLADCSAKLKLEAEHTCDSCGETHVFETIEMPNVFAEILE
jgi:hypothetical protein